MSDPMKAAWYPPMRDHLSDLLQRWARKERPTREDYLAGARELEALRARNGDPGLWPRPPLMVTATLDDGLGHGLAVIESLAAAAGVRVYSLGVLQPPAVILAACRERQADLLGLTVLQFDSDDALRQISAGLPPSTTLIAGGAAFLYEPDFAGRTGARAVARDGAAFLRFLLHYQPTRSSDDGPPH